MEDTTMKKTYINPELEIILLNTQYQLMAGSTLSARDEEPEEFGAREEDFDFDNF